MLGHAAGSMLGHLVSQYLFSPWGLIVIAVMLVAAGMYFFPAFTAKMLMDVRTWLVAAAVAFFLLFLHLQDENRTLVAQNAQIMAAQQTQAGATAALNDLITSKQVNVTRSNRLHAAIAAAPSGKKQDAVLDAIQAESAPPAAAPGGQSALDRLLDSRSKH